MQTTIKQFPLAHHYDVMESLDRDVLDDQFLSQTEAQLALHLLGFVPKALFLPMFGTGRHIPALLEAGVQRIVGVDISPRCVSSARDRFGKDSRLELHLGDLREWKANEYFDAAILLGNSFGDLIDPSLLNEVTSAMGRPLKTGAGLILDYIGEAFLEACSLSETRVWRLQFQNEQAIDRRTPRFDPVERIMTIDVDVRSEQSDRLLWSGYYQKRILSPQTLIEHFQQYGGIRLQACGPARALNQRYYGDSLLERGMLSESTWWHGIKGS